MEHVPKRTAYGVMPRNAEQTFALHALLNAQIQLVTLTGAAGTGKTLLALAAALEQRRLYRQIYLARPIVPLGNRDIGYLPGDIQCKLDPYMQPLWDNLTVIRTGCRREPRAQALDEMLENEKLTIAPLAYIRGRTLERLLHRRRGAEPDAARGQDDHHARRRGHEDRPDRRHPPDRHPYLDAATA